MTWKLNFEQNFVFWYWCKLKSCDRVMITSNINCNIIIWSVFLICFYILFFPFEIRKFHFRITSLFSPSISRQNKKLKYFEEFRKIEFSKIYSLYFWYGQNYLINLRTKMKNDLKHHVYNRLIHVLFRKIIFDDDRVEFFPRIILLSLNKAILSYILRDPSSCILSFHNDCCIW